LFTGNKILSVNNLSSLVSLTELNLRRNNIEFVNDLQHLPALQRIFLSHNSIKKMEDIKCLFSVNFLIELSLDGNPISELQPIKYRNNLILNISGLKHLDLKKVTDEERLLVFKEKQNNISNNNNNNINIKHNEDFNSIRKNYSIEEVNIKKNNSSLNNNNNKPIEYEFNQNKLFDNG
jgi:leucine-rich repeat-containing protein 49